ncbi:hypothetical protein ACFC0P_42190, partial [Streptomyces broussonetiae]
NNKFNPHPGKTSFRTWVDETVVSWAACLLADPVLATRAHQALSATEHAVVSLLRLTAPSGRDTEAAALLRHPDLLEHVACLHRPQLMELLSADSAEVP